MVEMKLASAAGAVCAVLDLVELGPSARLERLSQADLDQCRHALATAGLLDAKRSATLGPGWMALNLSCEIDSVIATTVADLHFAPTGKDAYQITQRSILRLSPLSHLADCGLVIGSSITYDGNTNFIGPTPANSRNLLERQCRYAVAIMEELRRCLGDALPAHVVSTEENMRLRRVELSRDAAVGNDRDAALVLSHSVLRGTRWIERDVYRAGSTDSHGPPVTRWWRKKKGVAYKVYAKAPAQEGRPGCLREEVSCQTRKAMQELGCDWRAELTGEGVSALLMSFIGAALPLLNALNNHVAAILDGSPTPADLYVALSSLVLPMSGAPTGGRPTSHEQVAQLKRAFNELVVTGQYRGKGLRKGLTLRSLLDALCNPGGPLEKDSTLCLYMLKPQYVRASQAMAAGSWQLAAGSW